MPYRLRSHRLQNQREYDKKHRKKLRAAARRRYHKSIVKYKAKRKQIHAISRLAVLAVLGNKCVHCGFTDWRALQIDHVRGGGMAETRKWKGNRSHFKRVIRHVKRGGKRYQLLCANCNWIKRYERNETKRS